MTTTIRAYADGSTTPVFTMAGLPDGTTAGVTIPGGALAPGVHSIITTAQIDGQAESVPSNARSVSVPAPVVAPPPVVVPLAGQWLDITPPNVLYAYKPLVNYGMQDIAGAKADQPKTIYVGSCGYGIQKSIDGGNTWVHVSTGRNGSKLGNGTEGSARNWSLNILGATAWAVSYNWSPGIYADPGLTTLSGWGGELVPFLAAVSGAPVTTTPVPTPPPITQTAAPALDLISAPATSTDPILLTVHLAAIPPPPTPPPPPPPAPDPIPPAKSPALIAAEASLVSAKTLAAPYLAMIESTQAVVTALQ